MTWRAHIPRVRSLGASLWSLDCVVIEGGGRQSDRPVR
jgi:hypothetical protein